MKKITQWITSMAFLSAVEAIAAVVWLLTLPKEGGGIIHGYSASRLVGVGALASLALICAWVGFWTRKNNWLSEKIAALAQHSTAYWVVTCLLLFVLVLMVVLIVKSFQLMSPVIIAYRDRLMPFIVWILLFFGQFFIILNLIKIEKIGAQKIFRDLIADFSLNPEPDQGDWQETIKNNHLKWIEVVIFAGFFLLLGWFLFAYAGGTSSWDELGYMNLALSPQPAPHILHRYAHIYFLKLFFNLAGGDPFLGSRLYWSFVITTTAAMVGVIASRFSARNILYGIISLSFFFTQERIWRYSGVPYADFSAMLWTTAALAAYLCTDHEKRRRICSFLLGLFVFIAFKSTDLGIVSAVLWLGLGFTPEGKYSIKTLFMQIKWVCLGVLIGQGLLCILDGFFLQDPFFSLRGDSWQAWLEFNGVSGILFHHIYRAFVAYIIYFVVGIVALLALLGFLYWSSKKGFYQHHKRSNQWILKWVVGLLVIGIWVYLQFYEFPSVPADKSYVDFVGWGRYLLSILWVAIGLFLISFIKQKEYGLISRRLFAWTYPLALFFVVSLMTGVSRRYFLSAIPTLVILSSQFMKLPAVMLLKDWEKNILKNLLPSIGISLVTFLYIFIYIMPYPMRGMAFLKQHLTNYAIWDIGIYGLFSLVLLLFALTVKRWRIGYQVAALSCIFVLTVPDIYYYIVPFARGDQIQLLERRFFPLEVSSPYFSCHADKRIFVSSNIYHDYGCFAPNASNLQLLFKLYFQCDIKAEQIMTSGNPSIVRSGEIIPIDAGILLKEPYDYLYLHSNDWKALNDNNKKILRDQYEVVESLWQADPLIDDFTTFDVNRKPVSIMFLYRKP